MALQTDPDTREVIDRLRAALAASRLSQGAFARALGTSGPRLSTYLTGTTRPSAHFLIRAQRIGRALGSAADQGLMSAPATAAAMRTHVMSEDQPWTWRMLLQGRDHLRLILGEDAGLAGAWEAEPASAGGDGWNALLAALTAHEFDQAGRPSPRWALRPALDTPWMPHHPFLTPAQVESQTPEWLAARNLFVPLRDVVTA